MDIISIAFIVGIALGTVSGLFFVRFSSKKKLSTPTHDPRRLRPTTSIPISRSTRPRTTKSRAIHRSRVRITVEHGDVETVASKPASTLQQVMPSCPACGLQAPELLMTEHFLGSPSHQSGPNPDDTRIESSVEPGKGGGEEDSRSAMRHLLQMLVPPRAFGRRHAERTVNPLSRLVQTLEEARSELVQPLKRT